jgi:hypothetical protein
MSLRKRKLSYAELAKLGLSPKNKLTVAQDPCVVVEMKKNEEITTPTPEKEPTVTTKEISVTEKVLPVSKEEIVAVEEVLDAPCTGYTYGDNPIKGKNYNDGFPIRINYRAIPGSKSASGERW